MTVAQQSAICKYEGDEDFILNRREVQELAGYLAGGLTPDNAVFPTDHVIGMIENVVPQIIGVHGDDVSVRPRTNPRLGDLYWLPSVSFPLQVTELGVGGDDRVKLEGRGLHVEKTYQELAHLDRIAPA